MRGERLGLQVPDQRVARRTMLYWALRQLLLWGGAWLVLRYVRDAVPDWLLAVPRLLRWGSEVVLWLDRLEIALLVVGSVMVLVSPPVRYQIHRWQTDDDAVYARDGLLRVSWHLLPTERIQAVQVRRDLLELLLGLSSVVVSSASSAGPVAVVGLDAERASVVAAALERRAELVPGEAT